MDLTQTHDVAGAYSAGNYKDIRKKYTDAGTKYAFDVMDGKQQAGYDMQLACFRHLQDLRRSENDLDSFKYKYDLSKVKAILNFAKICPDTDAGKPLPLMPWQKFLLTQLNGWRDQYGDKRYTEAHISVGRKQGKTYLLAIDSAYSFLIEGYGLYNQDYLVASNTASQTTKLYGYVAGMVRYLIKDNPLFSTMAKDERIEVQATQIVAKANNNRLVKISNESGKYDSYHFTSAVYDEAGDEKAGKYTSRIVTGQADVKNHQFIKISTAYEFLDTEFHNDLRRGVESMEQDYKRDYDNELCLIWSQDSESEVFKPDTWDKSNPLIDLPGQKAKKTHDLIVLRDTLNGKGKLNEFQNKNMNIYLQTSTKSFLRLSDISRATIPEFDITGREVYLGLDYSMFSDNAAIGAVFPYMRGDKQSWFLYQHSFIPWHNAGSIDAKEKQDGLKYRELAAKGFDEITRHPQGIQNFDQVYEWLMNFVHDNNLRVVYFGYDPWNATAAVKQLETNTDWPLEPIRQRTVELKEPTKFLQTGFIEGSFTRLDDPIMEKALLNAQVMHDKVGIQVDKAKATLKIDVVDALIDAMRQAMWHFKDYGVANDKTKQVDRMTPEQVKKLIESGSFGFGGDD